MKTLKKKKIHNTIATPKNSTHTHRSPTISRASHHRISHLQQSRTVKTNHKTQLRTQNLRGTAVAARYFSLSRANALAHSCLRHSSRGSAARGLHGSAALSSCGSCGSTRGSTRGSTLGSTLGLTPGSMLGLTPGSMLGSMRGSTSSCAGWSGDAGERVGGTETFVRGEDAGARGGGDASGGTCGVDLRRWWCRSSQPATQTL